MNFFNIEKVSRCLSIYRREGIAQQTYGLDDAFASTVPDFPDGWEDLLGLPQEQVEGRIQERLRESVAVLLKTALFDTVLLCAFSPCKLPIVPTMLFHSSSR